MKIVNLLRRMFEVVFLPIRLNALFFVFMYALGILSAWLTLPNTSWARVYDNLYLEMLLEVYAACVVLALLPRKFRAVARAVFYVVMYAVTLVDTYCFVKYDSTITPTMLLLVDETNGREAREFLTSTLSPDVMFSRVGWVLLLILVHILVVCRKWWSRYVKQTFTREIINNPAKGLPNMPWGAPVMGLLTTVLLVWGGITSAHNKVATVELMTGSNIGDVEHTLTAKDHAVLFTPMQRLVFSVYANSLASQQIDKLIASADKVQVDSCSYRSPEIVLIIGESLGRHHSQQYGYFMPTTPRQIAREKSGRLVPFTDVVSCWNLTSFVFKNVFSTHVIGQKGEWCDYPLFPELFRKAGYHVTFITNQFLPKAKEAVYDFSGGFFLNNPVLSKAQFDTRNDSLHRFDEDLLRDYDRLRQQDKKYNLTIFHLLGQHVNYRDRFPRNQTKFYASSYEDKRPELNDNRRKILSFYDNAVLYNDSVVDQIIQRFENRDAIVIYMPDHGEECYEETRGFICRNHSSAIDYPLAKYEFEIPFWIYCSPRYAHQHPEIYREIVAARNRKYMTDALPHLLLYLAGIHTPYYQAAYNVLSPQYDEGRKRILKNTADYDLLRLNYLQKK
ncbi:phosphoethanolamine transferase [Prevotella sp. S7 MS 2]|uniref:phosphoethanolamine transferase n=1 Tax=Prevotella sp. S7 MS 2 TaxID=1287488 RepID=UPI0005129D81|nr:phosphoethanolamine transferase [Prevotella sp. S7 MS 2]KGI61346.1 membrane protein [Prevotella sp. S7 MS 2]